jgi:Flp pilus assembly protein TadB
MLFWLTMAAAATILVYVWRRERARLVAVERLDAMIGVTAPEIVAEEPALAPMLRVFPPRYHFVVPATGVVVLAALWLIVGLPLEISTAFGALAAVFAYLTEDGIAGGRTARIDSQLAEAIDLLVSSLRAGTALLAAFEVAMQEARPPLRPYLQEVVGRIRLGDDPREVISALATQVPLETFRLFAMALTVHWEVGGSLAVTLATIGRTIRDRIDQTRRVRTQGIEAHVSVVVVLLIVYVLAYLMWRADPERAARFLQSTAGTEITAIVIALQAIGLTWMSKISRAEF